MSFILSSQLGQNTQYPSHYDPTLLFAVPRSENRLKLTSTPMHGTDIWTGYELSWLNPQGVPQVAIGEFSIPAHSPNIIESKSFKLYLNSLNQHVFHSTHELMTQVTHDLSGCAGAMVSMRLHPVEKLTSGTLDGECIDHLPINITDYHPNKNLLKAATHGGQHKWHSHLLKSNCPVTGQPDWGSVYIEMASSLLPTAESLLAYIIAYRNHQDFHEHCVESIYTDLWQLFQPDSLIVYARYVRRGGLDINPWRSNLPLHQIWPDMPRLARQ